MSRHSVRREVTAYLVIAYSLAIGVAVALPHAGINRLLSVLVPVTTVGILTFTIHPRGSRRDLWRSIGLGRSGRTVWLAALVVPTLLLAMAYGTALLLGVAHVRSFDLSSGDLAGWAANLVIGFVLGTVFILGEEIGWRGYLLPRVQELTSKRRAALVTGFAHGCFHLPLILLATTYDEVGSRWLVAPVVVVTITFAGVFYAYLWDRSRSVWPVAVAHNAANTMFTLGASAVVAPSATKLAYVSGESGLATLGAVVVVAVVLLVKANIWRREVAVEAVPSELVAA
ncbi:MAG: type II CAAX endopeptidase family protein [Sporichthyaceae bacterium]